MNASTGWLIDGNNVFGSRPDGWWNDRPAAMARFTNAVARWCWSHGDEVTVVFDRPVPDEVLGLAGGNLSVRSADRKGRNAADDLIALLADEAAGDDVVADGELIVVTSDKGLRARLPHQVTVMGSGRFRDLIGY